MAKKIKHKKNKKELEKEQQRRKVIVVCSVAGVIALTIAILLIVVLLTQNNGADKKSDNTSGNGISKASSSTAPNPQSTSLSSSSLEPSLTYFADINIRDYGKITVKLDQNAAPITVDNFVRLANSGFYNELTFHRIIKDFMMQGGDPEGTGNGGSGTNIKGEFSANGVNNPLLHERGAISMARANDMDSASSQFFIVQKKDTSLDGNYACFGYVTEGMGIVDKICNEAQPMEGTNGMIPVEQRPVIDSIVIRTENDFPSEPVTD